LSNKEKFRFVKVISFMSGILCHQCEGKLHETLWKMLPFALFIP
jgi:hypothetical protein